MAKIERYTTDLSSSLIAFIGRVLNVLSTTQAKKIIVTDIEVFVDEDDTIRNFNYRIVNSRGHTLHDGDQYSDSIITSDEAYKVSDIVNLIFALIIMADDDDGIDDFYIDAKWARDALMNMRLAINQYLPD